MEEEEVSADSVDKLTSLALRLAKDAIDEENFEEGLKLVEDLLKGGHKNSQALEYKGIACFNLDQFVVAKEAFSDALKIKETDERKRWIRKCDAEIDLLNKKASETELKNVASPPIPQLPSGPKTKYDWYQTESQVVITIMLKNVKKVDCHIDIQDKSVSATIKLASGEDYCLELDLAHPILPAKSAYKVLSTKIEIKLMKRDGLRWNKLEGDDPICAKANAAAIDSQVTSYPSSSIKHHDWDKLASELTKEEAEEKPEGDAALNQLFQKIYADGTDETKKAMMKSFTESGGTVLSTNWGEIGNKKVEVKPPDGMEYKQYAK